MISSCSESEGRTNELITNTIARDKGNQLDNIWLTKRGSGYKSDVQAELAATRNNDENAVKRSKLKYVIAKMDEIDIETDKMIKAIDDIIFRLLTNANEDISPARNDDPALIVWNKYDQKNQVVPSRLNLSALDNKDNHTVVNSEFIGSDQSNPSAKGIDLWDKLIAYQMKLIEITGTYKWENSDYEVTPIKITDYVSMRELDNKVDKMLYSSSINRRSDFYALKNIYVELNKYEGNNTHWIHSTFNNASMVDALASLTTLQNEILSARVTALFNWREKVATGSFTFMNVKAKVFRTSTPLSGKNITLEVLMVAHDHDNKPTVTTDALNATVEYSEHGTALVTFTPKKGTAVVHGTVAIRNRDGVYKLQEWEYKIQEH